jgi:hypothetical protein
MSTEIHIRCRPRPQNRNQWYRDCSASGSEKTLCGDQPTDRDMSWAETRWAKNRAFVTCAACIDQRTEQGVADEHKAGAR